MAQRSRWVLPQTVSPENTRCFQIEIPDDPLYIAAFKGTLYNLSLWDNWQHDDAHTGKDVAARMFQAYATIQEVPCTGGNLQIRACETGCGIEYSTDGANWTCIDLSSCIGTIWDEKLAQAFDDGFFQPGARQPGPTVPASPGQCKTYHVQLDGDGLWYSPQSVNDGYTVHITNIHGGWADGSGSWYCPDGKSYLFGYCATVGQHHEDGDLLNPGAWHMQIIGHVGDTYFDPLAATFTIPAGSGETGFTLLANDGLLSDNAGTISFDVEICTPGSFSWFYEWDLTQPIPGFTLDHGIWTSGVGVEAQFDQGIPAEIALMHRGILRTGHLTYMEVRGDFVPGTENPYNALDVGYDGFEHTPIAKTLVQMDSHFRYTAIVDDDVHTVFDWQVMPCYPCSAGSATLTYVAVGGSGQDPFSLE